jgi:hypothetical protein
LTGVSAAIIAEKGWGTHGHIRDEASYVVNDGSGLTRSITPEKGEN